MFLNGTYNISVGKGGIGAPVATDSGVDSTFGIYTAVGGGGGGHYAPNTPIARTGRSGGSGGGGVIYGTEVMQLIQKQELQINLYIMI
jgi:hypothetical protein